MAETQEKQRGTSLPSLGDLSEIPIPLPDLGWMKVPTEKGVRARPDAHGLTLDAINVGSYGAVPDWWASGTMNPRGAWGVDGPPSMGYSIFEKAQLWSDNAAELYEESVQRRWRPSTDVPWETVRPLPDEVEAAMCQLCTRLSEDALLSMDIAGKWLPQMSYGFHEVKVFIASQAYEGGQHHEAFRKRALANGGGLGLQSPGIWSHAVMEARDWSEVTALHHLLGTSFMQVVYQHGVSFAHNEAERLIFERGLEALGRHAAYGMGHLRFLVNRRRDRVEELQRYLDAGEKLWGAEWERDTAFREALILLLGGGFSGVREGKRRLQELRRRQVRLYTGRARWCGLDRAGRLDERLAQLVG